MENSLNFGMERIWSIGVCRGTNAVSVGYDEGVVLLKMGSEEPVASMDATGRIIYARHNDVHTAVIKALGADYEIVDGERLPLPIKVGRTLCGRECSTARFRAMRGGGGLCALLD